MELCTAEDVRQRCISYSKHLSKLNEAIGKRIEWYKMTWISIYKTAKQEVIHRMHFTTCNQHKMTRQERHTQNLQFLSHSIGVCFFSASSLCVWRLHIYNTWIASWSKWQRAFPCLPLKRASEQTTMKKEPAKLMFALHIRNRLF